MFYQSKNLFPMKKLLYFLLFFAFVSCKKDEVPSPEAFCHIVSNKVQYESDSDNYQYEQAITFNNNGQLSSWGPDITYEWTGNQLIQRVFYNGQIQSKSTYELDASGRALSQITTGIDGSYDYSELFEYNASGQLTRVVRAGSYASETVKEWSGGNLVREVNTTAFGDVRTSTYTYSNVLTPKTYDVLGIFGKGSLVLRASENNVYSFGASSSYTHDYELDVNGNVVREIIVGVSQGEAVQITIEYGFEGCE